VRIGRVLHLARREMLEQRRQPAMLVVIATLYGIVALGVLALVGALQLLDDEAGAALLAGLGGLSAPPEEIVVAALQLYTFLTFTQLLGIAAVCSGHAMLHERQCGTLSFLLLAPVGRLELLLGKVLGAIGWASALYLFENGVASLLLCAFPIAGAGAAYLPLSASWWVAFLLGGPAWAVLVGAICTVVSSASRDVRTAQQGTWFVVFFASLVAGLLLTWALPAGVLAQLAVAALAATGAGAVLFMGSQVLGRDLGR
jgi:ABC-type transport system involved in multi-copper enzyme maturation permease subunit